MKVKDLLVDVTFEMVEDARRFYGRRPSGRGPGGAEELAAARLARAVAAPSDPPADEHIVQAEGLQIPVRIFLPATGTARGVYLDIHGGGFYMDSAARDDVRNRALADVLEVVVVSVDYRLAPEHPWPAAVDDCEYVARWLIAAVVSSFGSSRLVIGGRSAGATLAMTTLLRLRDSGDVDKIAGAVLQFGTFDLSAHTPAGRRIADEYFLQAYVGHANDRTVADISPIYGDLSGLPTVLMVVGTQDVLLEDNLAMATRLFAAGNDVDIRIYPESPHGFTGHPTAIARSAVADINSWLLDRMTAVGV